MTATDSPLSRDAVVTASPVLKAALGLAFIAFSAGATVSLGGEDLRPWLADSATVGLFPDRYWIASLAAAGLTVGQIVTRARSVTWYLVLLLIDAIYTARQIYGGFLSTLVDSGFLGEPSGPLVLVQPAGPTSGQIVLAGVLAVLLGGFIARKGEELVFGKPRPAKAAATRK